MKTEDLNAYIYTKMVIDIAQIFWQERMRSLSKEERAVQGSKLSRDDLRLAVELFDERRAEVASIVSEPRS